MLDKTSIARPHARASAAALKYLKTANCKAISIRADVDGAEIKTGYDPEAPVVYWVPKAKAVGLAIRARHIMGDAADIEQADAAVKEAAAKCRATLTEHSVAISRAGEAVRKLKQRTSALKNTRVLSAFDREYAKRRQAAAARGEGFMTYNIAMERLRQAAIPAIMSGKLEEAGQSLFAEVFDR